MQSCSLLRVLPLLLLGVVALAGLAAATKLDDYVNAPDDAYSWKDLEVTLRGDGWTGYVLNITSQRWLSPDDWGFNARPEERDNIWYHVNVFIVPDTLNPRRLNSGFLWITGGNNNNPASIPDGKGQDAFLLGQICAATGVRGMVLHQVPNQPLFFRDEVPRRSRTEDAMIAYTWNHFIHKDPNHAEWLARFPMTKAAVRAMDAMSAFGSLAKAGGAPIDQFIVAGASKRGWTTWTTAAVDRRVVAFVPMVMDLLNVRQNTKAHYQSLNAGYSFAFNDYFEMGITADLDHPNTQKLEELVDGYHYRQRYAGRPFLMVTSSGDQFFLPDDSHHFWNEMPDSGRLLMLPNAEHSMITGIPQVLNAVSAFANAVFDRYPMPVINWKIDPSNGDIHLRNIPQLPGEQGRPVRVQMWYAQSARDTGLRDWRLMAGNPPNLQLVLWASQTLTESTAERNLWVARMPQPAAGHWMAIFVSVQFPGVSDAHGRRTLIDLTSQVSIWPTRYPAAPCNGAACRGVLR